MTEATHSFDDSAGYERFIGRWGRAAGAIFLEWVAPPADAVWLDVGCGTGLFTELVVETAHRKKCSRSTRRKHRSPMRAAGGRAAGEFRNR